MSGDKQPTPERPARILIVDDQDANLAVLSHVLQRASYRDIVSTTDPRHGLDLFDSVCPDLVLLDLHMPHLDGFTVLERIRHRPGLEGQVPVIVLTADDSREARDRALALGASDFLTKPYDPMEVGLKATNHLRTRALQVSLHAQNELLEVKVKERTADLEDAHIELFEKLARAADYRDDQTGQHAHRVGDAAAVVAVGLGWQQPEIELLRRAAQLHDIGKIGVSDAILLKEARLSERELGHIRRHTTIGASILDGSRSRVLRMAATIALTHHERWDGAGYHGLRESEIPIVGRITAVADVFDALTHERPYRAAWSFDAACGYVREQAGAQFDPTVAHAFLSAVKGGAIGRSSSQDVIFLEQVRAASA